MCWARYLFMIAVFALAHPAPASAEPATEQLAAALDGELARLHEETGFHGAVIVELHGEMVLEQGYGLANRSTGIAFTIDTPAQIGSISKSFTALAALSLAHDGQLDLFAPISAYLPDAAEPGASASMHQLMTHTAGLADDCGRDDFDPLDLSTLLGECLALPLAYEADTRPHYSNLGFSAAAAVVEHVSGLPLDAFLDQYLLGPNGLDGIGYSLDVRAHDLAALGYLDEVEQPLISDRIAAMGEAGWSLKGNGGMQASAREMWRWSQVLRGDGALDPAVLEAALLPRVQEEPGLAAGYGWYVRFRPDGQIRQISHSGSDGVFFSYFWLDPASDSFFYIVGSSGEDIALPAVRAVLWQVRAALE